MDGETRGNRGQAPNINKISYRIAGPNGIVFHFSFFSSESLFLNGQKFNANNSHGICRLDFCGSSTYTNWIKLLTTNTILIRRGFQLRMCHFS